eukprot:CAMPEP_0206543696 /NCGR_PEP_ID=MMETSP0325_2-20121206/11044_1 /ASSEMBLY_ACC=CAM_ASM_000347 /TAXON_ID=2866 /ORGANISM="Crypthecodinium cohnii, Strain Seligo" /LENGTH=626 /DNA_ID=CAMNT_0054042239 /DNA_START=93 /DNA_END=1973 /DNA_ORIENTATION=-
MVTVFGDRMSGSGGPANKNTGNHQRGKPNNKNHHHKHYHNNSNNKNGGGNTGSNNNNNHNSNNMNRNHDQNQNKQVFDPRRIFVGGLAVETGPEHLRAHFGCYGGILSSVVPWKNGQSRCFGYVTFNEVTSADAAINDNEGHFILGKKVDVKPAVPETNNKLFVGGLHQDVRDPYLRRYFEQFGEVLGAIVMMDKDSGRSRGFGFICYAPGAVGAQVIETVLSQPHVLLQQEVEVKLAEVAEKLPAPKPFQRKGNNGNNGQNAKPGGQKQQPRAPQTPLVAAFAQLLQMASGEGGITATPTAIPSDGSPDSTTEVKEAPKLPVGKKKASNNNNNNNNAASAKRQPAPPALKPECGSTTTTTSKPSPKPTIAVETPSSGSGSASIMTPMTKTLPMPMDSPTYSPHCNSLASEMTTTPAMTTMTNSTSTSRLSMWGDMGDLWSQSMGKLSPTFLSMPEWEAVPKFPNLLSNLANMPVPPTPSSTVETEKAEHKVNNAARRGPPPGVFYPVATPPGLSMSTPKPTKLSMPMSLPTATTATAPPPMTSMMPMTVSMTSAMPPMPSSPPSFSPPTSAPTWAPSMTRKRGPMLLGSEKGNLVLSNSEKVSEKEGRSPADFNGAEKAATAASQ